MNKSSFCNYNVENFILSALLSFVQVYCHGMLTNNPKEYITLKSGPQNNFAEYYHRRWATRLNIVLNFVISLFTE